jgi:hypothetical protein
MKRSIDVRLKKAKASVEILKSTGSAKRNHCSKPIRQNPETYHKTPELFEEGEILTITALHSIPSKRKQTTPSKHGWYAAPHRLSPTTTTKQTAFHLHPTLKQQTSGSLPNQQNIKPKERKSKRAKASQPANRSSPR